LGRGGEPDGRLPRAGPRRVQPLRRARYRRYRADTAADRDRDPHRRRRARLDLRAEGQVPDGIVRPLPATRGGDRRSAPRAPVIDLGTTSLPGQASGTRDAPPTSIGVGPLSRQTGKTSSAGNRPSPTRRPTTASTAEPGPGCPSHPGPASGLCRAGSHWQPVVDRRGRGLRSRVCLARPRLVCQPG